MRVKSQGIPQATSDINVVPGLSLYFAADILTRNFVIQSHGQGQSY